MSRPVSVVGRVAAILREVSRHPLDGAATASVARAVDLPRATVHRLLESLLDEGLVDRRTHDGRWFLGPEAHVLGIAAASRFDLTSHASESLRRLAQATGESAFFSVRRRDETVVLLRDDGDFPIRSYVLHEGARFPLGVASAGIAILAYLPPNEIEAYLARSNLAGAWGVEHGPAQLSARLRQTRQVGWAVNPGLIVEGSWGMAAAVFASNGQPGWALSLTGIEARFSADRQRVHGRLLLEEAHKLSRHAA